MTEGLAHFLCHMAPSVQQPRFMYPVSFVQSVCSSLKNREGFFKAFRAAEFVRADFKRKSLKLSAIWDAGMNFSLLAAWQTVRLAQKVLHFDDLTGFTIQGS